MAPCARRNEKLDLQVSYSAKRKLESAASVSNRTVSAFVLESALARADEALAGRRLFPLSKAKWTEFLAMLDAVTRPLPTMQRLLTEPWLGVDHGGLADAWLVQQAAYDLWQARKAGAPRVRRAAVIEA